MWRHLLDFVKNVFLLTERIEEQKKEILRLREGFERMSVQLAELAVEFRQQQVIADLRDDNLRLRMENRELRGTHPAASEDSAGA
jgi:hypothetical protein